MRTKDVREVVSAIFRAAGERGETLPKKSVTTEPAEKAEERLKLYALTCAALDETYKTLDFESDEAFDIQQAFAATWDAALIITDSRDFYSRIEKAKDILGFG